MRTSTPAAKSAWPGLLRSVGAPAPRPAVVRAVDRADEVCNSVSMQSRHGHWQGQQGQQAHTSPEDRAKMQAWFAGQLPDEWFVGPPEVTFDNDEILVVGVIQPPALGADATDEAKREAEAARIERFREDTRDQRMRIAEDAQQKFRRRVSWGAVCGETRRHFTTSSVPVMTRLRMPERGVLDTLIDAGVARSRSDAL